MKFTLHPQFLAALAISVGIFALQSRGFADTPHIDPQLRPFQMPEIVALNPIDAVIPQRNPFIVRVDEVSRQNVTEAVGLGNDQQEKVGDEAAKPNAKGELHLRAVVLGTKRYALMAEGSTSRIVTLGSPLAGSVVTEISLSGIALANGARFIPEETGAAK